MITKICSKCKKTKVLSDFYAMRRNSDGSIKYYYGYCKECASNICKIAYAKRTNQNIEDVSTRFPKIVNGKKYCNTCKQWKEPSKFYKNHRVKTGLESYCTYCSLMHRKAYRIIKRMEFVTAYGGKCRCCGETRLSLLTVEHIRHKGHKLIYDTTTSLIAKLKELNWPKDGYEVLCWNCNLSTKDNVPCVHTKEYKIYISNLEKFIIASNSSCKTTYFGLKKNFTDIIGS